MFYNVKKYIIWNTYHTNIAQLCGWLTLTTVLFDISKPLVRSENELL